MMNSLQFLFWYVMIGSGCGIVAFVWLIIMAIKDRPRKKLTIQEQADMEWKKIVEYGRKK